MTHSKKFDLSIGKKSVVDSDADALINWAKGLPDDVNSQNMGDSFAMN